MQISTFLLLSNFKKTETWLRVRQLFLRKICEIINRKMHCEYVKEYYVALTKTSHQIRARLIVYLTFNNIQIILLSSLQQAFLSSLLVFIAPELQIVRTLKVSLKFQEVCIFLKQ